MVQTELLNRMTPQTNTSSMENTGADHICAPTLPHGPNPQHKQVTLQDAVSLATEPLQMKKAVIKNAVQNDMQIRKN